MSDLAGRIDRIWNDEIVPTLQRYITIPNVSPDYDDDWEAHGHMDQAVDLVVEWCRARPIAGLTVDVQRLAGRTPLIVCEVPASSPQRSPATQAASTPQSEQAPPSSSPRGRRPDQERTVVLYGHVDKQPEMTGWRADGGPWTPILEGDRLYGRGGADDGYAVFAALCAIETARAEGLSHARCVVLIEASEESGSPDLPAHLEVLAGRLGEPELVVCLDSGAMDDERLWVTTSLRGLAGGLLSVDVLTEGVHSGSVSGVVPSSFRIIRQLLDRIEDSATGEVLVPELSVPIPDDRAAEAAATADELSGLADGPLTGEFTFAGGTRPMVDDPVEQLLARSWRPTISYVGADGFPPTDRAGNVLRPSTTLSLSVRLPPTCDPAAAQAALRQALTTDPPHGASVTFTDGHGAPGWNAPAIAPWLRDALDESSTAAFGRPARTFGEGGTIPFMGMLGALFPAAQFVITGVLVPGANAHGPNEFLHLPTARRVTECVARILDAHAATPVP